MCLETWKINNKTADGCFFSLFQLFIRELVRNLFNEGNDVYREGDWRGSLSHYTEAINVADYANSEEIHVSDDILEKLHVNRIACFSNMVSFCLNRMISLEQCASRVRRHRKFPSEWKAFGVGLSTGMFQIIILPYSLISSFYKCNP